MVLPQWLDLDGRLAGLQELPIVLQLCSVTLRPGFNEALLRLEQAAAETLECVDREHRRLILVVRVKCAR
jgi:hypothetical protein